VSQLDKEAKIGLLTKFDIANRSIGAAQQANEQLKATGVTEPDAILNNKPILKPKKDIMGVSNAPANKWASEILDEMYEEKVAIDFSKVKDIPKKVIQGVKKLNPKNMTPKQKDYAKRIFHENFLQKGVSSVIKAGAGAAVGYGVGKVLGDTRKNNNHNNNLPIKAQTITIDVPSDSLRLKPTHHNHNNYNNKPRRPENIDKTAAMPSGDDFEEWIRDFGGNSNKPFNAKASWKKFFKKLPKELAGTASGVIFPAITAASVGLIKSHKQNKNIQVDTKPGNKTVKLPPPAKGFTRITVQVGGDKTASLILDELYKEAKEMTDNATT
jgi:hypothetical protein